MQEVRPRGSKPFVRSGNEFLLFCLTCRSSGITASRRLRITNEWLALDLDAAADYVLRQWDGKEKLAELKISAKLIAREVGRMFGGGEDEDDDEFGEQM